MPPLGGALARWGIKTRTNDELRQDFIDTIVPELHALQLSIPDPELRYDQATGNWLTGPIQWDEFWQVIQGKGPCNQERMEARLRAQQDGAWVREAMRAYAESWMTPEPVKAPKRTVPRDRVGGSTGEDLLADRTYVRSSAIVSPLRLLRQGPSAVIQMGL